MFCGEELKDLTQMEYYALIDVKPKSSINNETKTEDQESENEDKEEEEEEAEESKMM